MDVFPRSADPDRIFVRLAGGLLGGSAVVSVGFFVMVFVLASGTWMLSHPGATAEILVGAVAFVISAACLTQLARRTRSNQRRLWSISLIAQAVIVVLVAASFGLSLGLVLCIPELLGMLVHIAAIRKLPASAHGV
jgi:hypothetical protein